MLHIIIYQNIIKSITILHKYINIIYIFKHYWAFLCARKYSKRFINIDSFISYSNLMRYNYYSLFNSLFTITPILQVRKLRLNDLKQLCKVTDLVNVKAVFQHITGYQASSPHTMLFF